MGRTRKALKTLRQSTSQYRSPAAALFGYFPVKRPVRTMYVSGESGWRVLQENVRRIGLSAGASEKDLENLLVGVKLPKLSA